ncbi:WXG100-like domain-containing protein [Actinomadura sp. 3N407]|uniref:WXG100-like domain-containing protein n=1 Tax=Actinomadura sp. 3N407 TaxID=3457423 RepID=UPI003FCEAA2B
MGLQLPGELISLLSMLGYTWPEADETKLLAMGGAWLGFAGAHGGPLGEADGNAQRIMQGNRGDDIEAFRAEWTKEDSPKSNLEDLGTAATIIGAGLMVCGGIVLALKINVIIQLTILAIQIAQAIATAAVTFGASLLEIPIFKELAGIAIDLLIDMALQAIFNG